MKISTARRAWPALALLAVIVCTLQVRLAWSTGLTVDEPSHIVASHYFWVDAQAYRLSDLAPLVKMATGWVSRTSDYEWPAPDDQRLQSRDEWNTATGMFIDRKDPALQRMTFAYRLPMLLFPALTMLLLFAWGKMTSGAWSGLLAAAIFAFEPTALAHGALVKNDVAAAMAYLAFWFAAWRFWVAPSLTTALLVAGCALLGVAAKLSLVILAGIVPLLILGRLWGLRRWLDGFVYLSACLGAMYLGLCTLYLWDVRVLHPVEIVHKFEDPRIPWAFTYPSQIFQYIPAPRYFWEGCVSLFHSSAARPPIYFLGEVRHAGHPLYFLVALAVKVPVALQVLTLAAFAFGIWEWIRRRELVLAFFMIPPVLYIALASLTGHQLGIRLILPALPFAALLAGRIAVRYRRATVVLVLLAAAESMTNYPHQLSFFNLWAGGSAQGLRYLADSNLDWGQDLRLAAQWARENKVEKLKLAYFGTDTPWRHFSDKNVEIEAPPWGDAQARGRTYLAPEPGVYAISATLLPGQFFPDKYQNYYKEFLRRKPDAYAGWSIYIYDLRGGTQSLGASVKAGSDGSN